MSQKARFPIHTVIYSHIYLVNEIYTELLAGYIALGRLPEAKFLWKRIPGPVKEEIPELGKIIV